MRETVPVNEKYLLTLPEAADYFGIGYKKLRTMIANDKNAPYILWNGSRAMIRRKMFERYIDNNIAAI